MADPHSEAMETLSPYGFPKAVIQRTISKLLLVYGGESAWPLLKEDNFSVILEKLLSDQSSGTCVVQKLPGKDSLKKKRKILESDIEKASEPCISFHQRQLWMKHFMVVPSVIFTDQEEKDDIPEQKYGSLVIIGNNASQKKEKESVSIHVDPHQDKTPVKGIENSIEQSTAMVRDMEVEKIDVQGQYRLLLGMDVPVLKEDVTESEEGSMTCEEHSSDSESRFKDAMECNIGTKQSCTTGFASTNDKIFIKVLNEKQCEIHENSMPLAEAWRSKSYTKTIERKAKAQKVDVGRNCASKLTRRRDGCPNPMFQRIQKAKKVITSMEAVATVLTEKAKGESSKSHSYQISNHHEQLSSNKFYHEKGIFDHNSGDDSPQSNKVNEGSERVITGNNICQDWTPAFNSMQIQWWMPNKDSEAEIGAQTSENNYDVCDGLLSTSACKRKTDNIESNPPVSGYGKTKIHERFYHAEVTSFGYEKETGKCESGPPVSGYDETEFYESKNGSKILTDMSRLCFIGNPHSLTTHAREVKNTEECEGKFFSKGLPHSTDNCGLPEITMQEKEQLKVHQESNAICSSLFQTADYSPNDSFGEVTLSDLGKENQNAGNDKLMQCMHASPELPPGFDTCPGRSSSPELPPGFDNPGSCPSRKLAPEFETPPGCWGNTLCPSLYAEACRMWHGTVNHAMENHEYDEHMTCGSGWISSDDEL